MTVRRSEFVHDGKRKLFLLGNILFEEIQKAEREGWTWVRTEREFVLELPTQEHPFRTKVAGMTALAELERPLEAYLGEEISSSGTAT